MIILRKCYWFHSNQPALLIYIFTKLFPQLSCAGFSTPFKPPLQTAFCGGKRSNQNTEKAQEPPGDIWRMPNMADKWRHSCARLRVVSQERGVMRPLTHDSVCLVSDTERQPIRRDGKSEKRGEKKEEKRGEGWDESGWRKTDGEVKRSKLA